MRRALCPLLLALALAPAAGRADTVVASEQVQSKLRIRDTAGGRVIGSLLPGERVTHLATQGEWRQVALADGRVGFVSAAWSRVVPEPEPAPSARVHVEHRGLGQAVRGFFRAVASRLGARPKVELVLRDPVRDSAIYEHDDPLLPVAGLATPEGSSGTYDIVIALDTSTSTQGFAEADVNGDGRLDDRWKGPDSIYRAQIRAAREFVAALGRLPYNRGGERIRVGVVGFAGDEDAEAHPFERSPTSLLQLARVDAEERIPLSSDYARVDRQLEQLASRAPVGSTDFAAGVGRALECLGVLTPDTASAPPSGGGAQKAILFLTDGKPQLPGDRKTAERAALYASRLAGDAGVRIHTFALGRDVVRRGVNPVLPRMAERSGGSFTQLAAPGEVVALLQSTSFSFVSSVRIANATRAVEIPEIPTAIDGSFYGEVPLAEGPNQIEVEAVLNDGRRTSKELTVTWVDTKPKKALEARLAALREENASLVEQVRERLVREMKTARSREGRELTISVSQQGPTQPGPAKAADR